MGKTRDLVKKIGGTKGTFHAKMGTINDSNGRELKEAKGNGEKERFECSVSKNSKER